MSSTTFAIPATRSALPVRRRIAAYFTGGVAAVPGIVGLLAQQGRTVHELSVDIRDGVRESGLDCTVLLPGDEVEFLLDRLRDLGPVVSAELV
ncbi:hypothetical protein AMYBAR_003173 [Amycolatopsis bartoniae]|uniref:Uncharacterized protein n=1 Tax=Amycolatopsis bartoniae TaxID=941986 RepID=A0A8H9M561_9PSEU|nr:hypothetical protein [Amycolatopsis bartoniae]TVS98733.1 hypothetical protein FNH07_36760 [Amycolatopsis bartoniae]GHF53857.1 hypothetical protein GCM10017566_29150 [Amycolatopsis bartoniae]